MTESVERSPKSDPEPPAERAGLSQGAALRVIKIVHTIAWAFFAGCIIAIPVFAWLGRFVVAFALIAVVMVEVVVLLLNGWSCPLTGVAARFTDERQDNFDIYLPLWLARYNKHIFGSLFVAGLLFTLVRLTLVKTP